jgi:hypothetical protein
MVVEVEDGSDIKAAGNTLLAIHHYHFSSKRKLTMGRSFQERVTHGTEIFLHKHWEAVESAEIRVKEELC